MNKILGDLLSSQLTTHTNLMLKYLSSLSPFSKRNGRLPIGQGPKKKNGVLEIIIFCCDIISPRRLGKGVLC